MSAPDISNNMADSPAEELINDPNAWMDSIDRELSHLWMVRTFLKHSDEASDDEELAEVHRGLYDFMLALGPALDAGDANRYLKLARKKFSKLKSAANSFGEIQPEVSGHMNFVMAAKSLALSVANVERLLTAAERSIRAAAEEKTIHQSEVTTEPQTGASS